MGYQALIIKCSRDFEGLAWAQYDRAYRHQAAQSKDLRWSKLNPLLYSLCFAGKARRNVACCHCLSDMHTSEACLENPTRALLSWSMPSFAPGTSMPPQPSWQRTVTRCLARANRPESSRFATSSTPETAPAALTTPASLLMCV